MDNILFYKDKPIFGLDVGFSSLKVMQIQPGNANKRLVTGYGVNTFEEGAIVDGVLVKPEVLAKSTHDLFTKNLIGEITTRRVAMSIPASRTFNRLITLPKSASSNIDETIRLEAEQYVPMALDDLYLDHTVINSTDNKIEVLSVAAPKKIIDSYLTLANLLGLEVAAIETTISSAGRIFVQSEQSDVPTVLIDLGSLSSDITIYDDGLVVTGTVPGGGDSFSNLIADKLGVTKQEAHIIKTKYGLGLSKKQKEITDGLSPILNQLVREIKRMIRYYEERTSTKQKIAQVVTMGGGANMPGLAEYMTNQLRLPVRMSDPWQHLSFNNMQPPNSIEKTMYVTVAGLSLIQPKDAL